MIYDTKKTATGNDFLVFINFSQTSYNALDYTINLVKAVGGSIEIHNIINPSEIKDTENHLVAVRSMNEIRHRARKKMNSLVEMLHLENIEAKSSYSMGHYETELKRTLAKKRSKIVVIGKRKSGKNSRTLNALINHFTGNVIVVNDDTGYQGENKIVIGMDGQNCPQSGISFVSNLSKSTKIPIVILIAKNGKKLSHKGHSIPMLDKGLEIYMDNIEENNALDGLLEYVKDNEIELLCVGRNKNSRLTE